MKIKQFAHILLSRLNGYKVQPNEIILDISASCNSRCPFCPRQMMDSPPKGIMEPDIFYNVISQLNNIPTIKRVRLYAAGEPLLHPRFGEYVDAIADLGLNVGVSSNMSLADRHFDTLMKLEYIQFSIEGWDKLSFERYRLGLSFEKVRKNVEEFDNLIKARRAKGLASPSREIHLLLTKKTQIKDFIDLWLPLTDRLVITPMYPQGIWDKSTKSFKTTYADDLYDEYLPFKKLKGYNFCNYPFNIVCVNWEGKLSLCCSDFFYHLDCGTSENLHDSFFKSPGLTKVRREFKKNKLKICNDCHAFYRATEILKYFPELEHLKNVPGISLYI